MLRLFKNFFFNVYLELRYPNISIEKDVSVHSGSYWRGRIVFGKHIRLVRGAVLHGTIQLGDYSYINSLSELQAGAVHGITIGKFCSIGRNVFITSVNNHHPETLSSYPVRKNILREAAAEQGAAVHIGHDVWIGANAVILPGTTIGNGAVVAAGAVVPAGTTIAPYEIWGGVPAKKIKDRFSATARAAAEQTGWWNWSEAQIRAERDLFIKEFGADRTR